MSKRVSNEVRNPSEVADLSASALRNSANVKKVPNGRVQGLDLGEIVFRDFPFRLWKSLK